MFLISNRDNWVIKVNYRCDSKGCHVCQCLFAVDSNFHSGFYCLVIESHFGIFQHVTKYLFRHEEIFVSNDRNRCWLTKSFIIKCSPYADRHLIKMSLIVLIMRFVKVLNYLWRLTNLSLNYSIQWMFTWFEAKSEISSPLFCYCK